MAMYEGMLAETVRIKGHNGDEIDAYLARPLGAGPFPGVVLIHHMPGWDEWTREVVQKLALHGYAAISANLHHRIGPVSLDDVVAAVRTSGGTPADQFLADSYRAVDPFEVEELPFLEPGDDGYVLVEIEHNCPPTTWIGLRQPTSAG